MADKSKSQSDNFIAKIVKDPRQVPDTLLLSGYLGTSSEDKYTRLYFDAQLASYVEIPDDGILHTQDYPEDPLGKNYVWIKKDAVLIHGKAGTKAKFLEGPIVTEYMNIAGFGQQGPVGDTIFICPETHLDFPCGTTRHGWACTIVELPTQERYCPTRLRPYCPPITRHNCPTYSDGPAICPTRICEVQYQGIGQQQAQPLGFTFPLQNCPAPTFISPYCHTLVGPKCVTHTSPICNYTISDAICPTHTPACIPSVKQICVTHTPVCYPSIRQICVTHISPPCNIKTVNDPICNEAISVIGCPIQTAICPTAGACPSIACGFGGGFAGNPGY